LSFIDDSLLKAGSNIQNHGEDVQTDEELTPTLENMIILTWLRLINTELPALIKQRYGKELRSKTLASLKPEISQALDSLLEEIHATNEAKVLRTAFQRSSQQRANPIPASNKNATKSFPLCKQTKRSQFQHYLSQCPFLPNEDRQYLSRTRHVAGEQKHTSDQSDSDPEPDEDNPLSHNHRTNPPPTE
jgi:hypothetical protein